MPRFVILEHDWPVRHWDLLLEAGEVLWAWRLLAEPVPGSTVAAVPNADHRLLYLDYEGPVSGGRGRVFRWAAGVFDWIEDVPGRVRIRVTSDRLSGQITLAVTDQGGLECRVSRERWSEAAPGEADPSES
jgi:hypothetical protein